MAASFGWGEGLQAVGLGLSIVSGALNASAARESARANASATRLERDFNLGVMRQNKIDTYASNMLQSWGSGINPFTGSTNAVILGNQETLQKEIDFQKRQYDTQIANYEAQAKQKFLGIF